ncbi:MAG: tetratricopeptide repeat protein [Anaerolineaceae bacterium]|nr:tetratricopeptide repeat protein [Anaerolineaceae bacterium]
MALDIRLEAQKYYDQAMAAAKEAKMEESICLFSKALNFYPFEGIYYRYRGHRHLNLRQFDEGAADLELASRLIPENWDVWYHLGLAHYLRGEFEKAAVAYQRCLELTETKDAMIAIVDWYWMTLTRLGQSEKAEKLLEKVSPQDDPGENIAYFERVLLYKGLHSLDESMAFFKNEAEEAINRITCGYGLGNYLRLKGDAEGAKAVWKELLALAGETRSKYAFACLAAESELERA